MNRHVKRFFQEGSRSPGDRGNFYQVVALHENLDLSWEEFLKEAPGLPKGWYELSRLEGDARLEFVLGYWLSTLPYVPHMYEKIQAFFDGLESIEIFLTKETKGSPTLCQMVYSLKHEEGFFHGLPPVREESIESVQKKLPFYEPPVDYLAFLRIHDGFGKACDTGIIQALDIEKEYQNLQEQLEEKMPLSDSKGEGIRASHLVPFYQSFGMPCYQCFYLDWYPEAEVGNVYYSGNDHFLSDYRKTASSETLAFPSFLDWLAFYLESIVIREEEG